MENTKKLKGLSKALYIITFIAKICVRVGLVCLVLALLAIPAAISNVKVTESTIEIFQEKIEYEERNSEIIIKHGDEKETFISPTDVASFKTMINLFKDNKIQQLTFSIELAFILICALMICFDFALQHLEKLFRNIHDNENPFLPENAEHLRKIGYFLIASLILSFATSILSNTIFTGQFKMTINVTNIVEILFVLCLSYIFEFGASFVKKAENKNESFKSKE